MPSVALVSLYESGHQPLALAHAAARLRRDGIDVACVDLAVDALDDRASAILVGARTIAIAVPMHTALRLALRLIPRLREIAPDARVVCFGLYAPLHAAVLRRAGAHAIVAPEEDDALTDLARGREPSPRAGRLASIAPARDLLPPLDRYAKLIVGDERRLAGHVEGTRGCKHLCRHCPIPPVYHGRFFAVPVDDVIADASAQIARGARHVSFGDADFLNGPRHAVALAEALHAAHPDVTWDATIKVEHIVAHADLFPAFARAGCVFVVSAVESLSDRVLAILDKGHTAADAARALAIVRGAGISFRPTFVPFTPWTTLDDYLEIGRFIDEHALWDEVDPVQLSLRLLVPPGSLLLDHHDLGPLDEQAGTHVWTHRDPKMDALQRDVAALVERAVEGGDPAVDTFAAIQALAVQASGRRAPEIARVPRRPPPPRLSEPWFC